MQPNLGQSEAKRLSAQKRAAPRRLLGAGRPWGESTIDTDITRRRVRNTGRLGYDGNVAIVRSRSVTRAARFTGCRTQPGPARRPGRDPIATNNTSCTRRQTPASARWSSIHSHFIPLVSFLGRAFRLQFPRHPRKLCAMMAQNATRYRLACRFLPWACRSGKTFGLAKLCGTFRRMLHNVASS